MRTSYFSQPRWICGACGGGAHWPAEGGADGFLQLGGCVFMMRQLWRCRGLEQLRLSFDMQDCRVLDAVQAS